MNDMRHLLETSNPLRGTALFFLGNVAIAGGRERFAPYLSLGLTTALDMVSSAVLSWAEKDEGFIFIANLLIVIQSDFAKHLSTWVPIFVACLQSQSAFHDCMPRLTSSVLKAISSVAKCTGPAFEPHFLAIYQAIRAIDHFSINDPIIREGIFPTYTDLFNFLHSGQPLSILTPAEVEEITNSITNTCLLVVREDMEEKCATAASDALANFVESIGLTLLKMSTGDVRRSGGDETFRAAIIATAVLVLEGKAACQTIMQMEENEGSDNDEDNEGSDGGGGDDYGQDDAGDRAAHDMQQGLGGAPDVNDARDCRAILSSVFGLINEVAKAVGPNFIGHFEDLKPLIFGYTDRKHNHVLRAMAVGCLAETTEYIGPIMVQNVIFVDSIISVLEWSIRDESEMLRRNSAYCLSVVIRYLSSSSLAFHAPRIFKWISPLCHHRIQAGRTNMGGADVDNVLTALARLAAGCDSEEVPRLTSLSMLLEALPLREDFVEGLAIYTIIVNLVKGKDAATLTLMPQLLASFAQVLDEKSQYCEDTKTLVKSCLMDELLATSEAVVGDASS
jgi:hypothetical protein